VDGEKGKRFTTFFDAIGFSNTRFANKHGVLSFINTVLVRIFIE